ncbi:MAG: 30S ribosomal protein S8 [Candidatus Woesearchaeota archaeon]|nr:MAG: 30S ribosomal protein S8 [Candidatus Woesearchaeota archaeon]
MNDPIASALSKIDTAVKRGKNQVVIYGHSQQLKTIFSLLQEHQYLGSFEEMIDRKGNYLIVNLLHGSLNKVGAIKPRYPVKVVELEKFEKRYLPSKDFGFLIVSTSKGMMTNAHARKAGLGGVLVAYCY